MLSSIQNARIFSHVEVQLLFILHSNFHRLNNFRKCRNIEVKNVLFLMILQNRWSNGVFAAIMWFLSRHFSIFSYRTVGIITYLPRYCGDYRAFLTFYEKFASEIKHLSLIPRVNERNSDCFKESAENKARDSEFKVA